MAEALLFPGQGAQFEGMGRDWAEACPKNTWAPVRNSDPDNTMRSPPETLPCGGTSPANAGGGPVGAS